MNAWILQETFFIYANFLAFINSVRYGCNHSIAIKKGKSSLSNSELLQSQILYSEENLAGKCRTVAIHIFPGYRAQGPGL